MIPMDEGDGETLEMDRLSGLPDAVLCHVLSFLPTKYSARTTALSTRWKYLFAYIPIIDCDDDSSDTYRSLNQSIGRYTTFVSFVFRALHLVTNRLSHITKLRIRFHRDLLPISVVCSWIIDALRYNVQEIDFNFKMMESGPLPREVFTSQSLVVLKLKVNFVPKVPDCVCLINLKTLELGHSVSSDDESLRKLFSSCPVLEELYLSCKMDNIIILNISVPSLKKLSLNILDCYRNYLLFLNTPCLEYLCCESYASIGYYGYPMISLEKAYINVTLKKEEEMEETKIGQLLGLVRETRFLSIDGDVLEALVFSDSSLPMFDNLTHLELSNNLLIGWEILPELLQVSPHLEVLVFEWGYLDENVNLTGFTFSKPESVPECLSLRLKTVKFKKFLGEEPEYELIEYLLKNGEVLEEMIVRKDSCIELDVELSDLDEEIQSEMEEYFEISKKLLSFPRRSRACKMVFDAVPKTKEAFFTERYGYW